MLNPSFPSTPLSRSSDLLRLAQEVMISITRQGSVASWNVAAEGLYGFHSGEMLGRPIALVIAEEFLQDFQDRLERLGGGSHGESFHTVHQHALGHRLEVRVTLTSLRAAEGEVIGALLQVAADAHSERAAQRLALEHQLELTPPERAGYESVRLLESLQDHAVYWLDPAGRIRSWPPAAAAMTGFASGVIGKHFGLFYPPKARAAGLPAYALEVARNEGRFESTGWRLRQDGSSFWAKVSITPIRDGAGELLGYAKVVRDETQRRDLEARARFGEDALRARGDAVLITDADLDAPGPRILYANERFLELCGYTLEELLGQTPRLFQGPDTDRAMLARLREALKAGSAFTGETINYRRDARPYRVQWQIHPVREADGQITRFVALLREVERGLPQADAVPQTQEAPLLDVSARLGDRARGASLSGRIQDIGGLPGLARLMDVLVASGELRLDSGQTWHLAHGRVVAHRAAANPSSAVSPEEGFEFVRLDPAPTGPLDLSPLEALLPPSEVAAEGTVVLPDVAAAVLFASSIGRHRFRARLEPHCGGEHLRVVLRGPGLRVIALNGSLEEVPDDIGRVSGAVQTRGA